LTEIWGSPQRWGELSAGSLAGTVEAVAGIVVAVAGTVEAVAGIAEAAVGTVVVAVGKQVVSGRIAAEGIFAVAVAEPGIVFSVPPTAAAFSVPQSVVV